MFLVRSCRSILRGNNPNIVIRQASISVNPNKNHEEDLHVPKSWSSVVVEAEKIVGYPTSFLNLRWLLSDEFANVAFYVKKLIGISHPILLTVRNLLIQNTTPSWGLIVLLISKAGGLNTEFPETDRDLGAGLLHSQRVLAEVAEMLRTSSKIHKSLYHVRDSTSYKEDMYNGNKIALLLGDYLLSSSCKELANIKNQVLIEIMSAAIRDMWENEFVGLRDEQNFPLPSRRKVCEKDVEYEDVLDLKPLTVNNVIGHTKAEWTLRSMLGGGSVLANCCRCTLMLAKHTKETQKLGYLIGKHIALSWQAYMDLEPFLHQKTSTFSLVSAPVLYHLDHDPSIYPKIECGLNNTDDVNYTYLRSEILKGPAIEATLGLQQAHAKAALEQISLLVDTEAKAALENIVKVLL